MPEQRESETTVAVTRYPALHAVTNQVGARPDELRRILDTSSMALIAFDPQRRIEHANAIASAFFGYRPGELDGAPTDWIVPERFRQPDAPPMLPSPEGMQIDLPGLRRDGSELLVEWRLLSVPRGDSQVFIMEVRDRGQLDRADEVLRASEERFRLLVDGVQDHALFLLDADGRVSTWNTGATRIKGWGEEEILGQHYEVFFTPEDRARGRPQELLAAAAREGHIEMTGVRQRKDGSRFWAHARLTALRHPDGKLRGYAKLTRDLTERIQADEHLFAERAQRQAAEAAEQRIRASEEQLARVQRMTAAVSRAATPDQVAEVVLDEGLKAVGAEGGAVYGAAEGGSTLTLLRQHGHPRESEANFRTLDLSSKGPLTDAARKQLPLFLDSYATCAELYPHLREAMSRGGFEASAALPLIAHGQLMGVLGVRYSEPRAISDARRTMLMTISDICAQALERARLFAAEQRARLEAEAANRAKDEFLAMLGHELRNPLAPIVTAVQLMRLRGDGALEKERGVIERQVTHLTRLVDDLLDVSRITQGKVELHLQRVEVAEVVARALEMASPLLEQRHQHVAASVPQRGLAVDADPMRLSQVISNLLTNAARYTNPGGHIAITAERSQGHVAVRVKDDGIGIAPEMLPRIFDLFVQGHRKLDRSEGGLGLGLSIVHTLMSLHGGKVHAFSDGPDKGSEFVVELPAATVQDSQVPASPLQVAPSSSSGRRILVVDDNEDAAELLADFLRSSGHVARVAHDGPGALRIVTEFKPQAALLDIGLPVMDGYELARRLREQIANLQLVAISGYGQESDRKRALEAGFQGHLVKPVELEVLRRVLDAVNVGTEAADSRQARNSRI